MHCSCGHKDCVTRIYVDDAVIPGVTVYFNPEVRADDEQVHVTAPGQLLIPACDAALKQLVKDTLFVLHMRGAKQLLIDIGLEKTP